jgi:probable HAF family extracellular repeat protein
MLPSSWLRNWRCSAGAVATVLFSGAVSTASAAAILTPLGDLPGGVFDSRANAVSADGSVVVGTSSSTSGSQTFRWTAGGGMVGLGVLPGDAFSEPGGVSADGSVVVGYSGTVFPTFQTRAFRWTAGPGMVSLGVLPGDTSSTAKGVSGAGSVVAGASGSQTFRWTTGTGMVGLGTLPGDTSSQATAISADGLAIVGNSGSHAYRWTAGTGMVDLGSLPGDDLVANEATGVSANGSVIVGQSQWEAFRWTASGMTGLGFLPGESNSRAEGVSGDGSVVFGTASIGEGYVPFLWTAGSGMQQLGSVLAANGVNPAADGWTNLTAITGISADGHTIVGYGNRSGGFEGFVAVIPTIPEPGSVGLIAVASVTLLRRRRVPVSAA